MDITSSVNTSTTGLLFNSLFKNKANSIEDITSAFFAEQISPQEGEYYTDFVNQKDSAAISEYAFKLSSVDLVLKANGNSKGQEGLREISKLYSSDSQTFNNFMDKVINLESDNFQNTFFVAGKMGDSGIDVNKFADTVSKFSDNTTAASYLETANTITDNFAMKVSDKEKILKSLNFAVETVQNSDLKYAEQNNNLQTLFSSVAQKTDYSEVSQTINDFIKQFA
jgi:hypothetical protein